MTELCRSVVARAHVDGRDAAALQAAGVCAVGLDLSRLASEERTLVGDLKDFAEAADAVSLPCYVLGLRSKPLMIGAIRAGFAHLGGEAADEHLLGPARYSPFHHTDFLPETLLALSTRGGSRLIPVSTDRDHA